MSFLHTFPIWLLIALPLIPVILHLLTLQRLKTIELPTFRFLFDSYVQQRRRTQFLEALIALLRILCILGIMLVILRPYSQNTSGLSKGGSNRDVYLLIDCSASMDANSLGESALNRAKQVAQKIVTSHLSPGDHVTLIRVVGKPDVVFTHFAIDAPAIKDSIAGLQISPARANLFATLHSIFGDEKKRPINPLVYFVTDRQQSSWIEIEQQQQSAERFLPAETPLVLIDVGSDQNRANIGVIGNAPSERCVVGLPIELQAHLVKSFDAEAALSLSFSVNDQLKKTVNVTLPAGQRHSVVRIRHIPEEDGVLRCKFQIEPANKAQDFFPNDNAFLFALPVQPRLRVLIVNGAPDADRYKDEVLYLRAALSPKRADAAFDPRTGALDQTARILDLTVENEAVFAGLDDNSIKNKLDNFGLVILANCGFGVLPPAQQQLLCVRLREYVAEGGGLVIFPGDKLTNLALYNDWLFQALGNPRDELTPVRFEAPDGDPDKEGTFKRLDNRREAMNHAIFSVFPASDKPDSRYFEDVYIKRRFPLTPRHSRKTTEIATYRDGGPALVESRFGEGLILVAGFPINAKWTNLPLNEAEFVPLMLQIVRYAQKRPDVEAPSIVLADQTAEFSISTSWLPAKGIVTSPRQAVREMEFAKSGLRAVAVFEKTGESGFYTAQLSSESDPTKKATVVFAVNLDPSESETARVTDENVTTWLPPAKRWTFESWTAESLQKGAKDQRREWWRWFIYGVFAVITAELLLATLRGGTKEAA
jgi:hypothetical protein